MSVAAGGLTALLVPELADSSPRLDRWFSRINQGFLPSSLRMVLRLALAQLVPLLVRRRTLVFSSHHAPLWRTGRHLVIVYDLIALHFPEQSKAQTAYYRWVLPRVLRCATRVVTISETVCGELHERFPSVAAAAVIPAYSPQLDHPGIQGAAWQERRQGARLAFVGARYRHKNLEVVLRAMSELSEDSPPPVKLVVAGCRRELWPRLNVLETAGRAVVHDVAGQDEVAELYRSAFALIYPSLAEGQGLPPLEAMHAGCPVICADIPVLRETCGDAAFYFQPHDSPALAELLREMQSGSLDGAVAQRQRAAAMQHDRFRAAVLRERWRQLFHEK
jgi:glycosyltransferase involved in cell wall biosynthesis